VLKKRKVISEINVVPYIDVMLVLLIIFMVTAPLLTQGIKVELPKAGAEPISDTSSLAPLILSVNATGELFINVGDEENTPKDAESIVSRTRAVLASQPTTMVLVKADRRVPYGNVVGAMVLLQQGGAENIGFVTDALESYPVPE
jgi:biopolymer transport protein TolR|tara:strand:- start:2028 stop:2462 length:435 start_codon:yes stop_codon:yes gene_type:complete